MLDRNFHKASTLLWLNKQYESEAYSKQDWKQSSTISDKKQLVTITNYIYRYHWY